MTPTKVSLAAIEYKLIRMDRLLLGAGLATSLSDAGRLLRQGAVAIKDGDLPWEGCDVWGMGSPVEALMPYRVPFMLRVGKRVKKVTLAE
jgi:hypothetical protein